MKPKVWPKLDLERLSDDEAEAIKTACGFIIELVHEPSPLARYRRNFRVEHPTAMVLMNLVVARELKNKASTDVAILLGQFGMEEVAIEEALEGVDV